MSDGFDFVRAAMAEVSYPRFFHTDSLSKEDHLRVKALRVLPESYRAFLAEFGSGRFFRELYRDSHLVLVWPPPNELMFVGTDYMMQVGTFDSNAAFFSWSEMQASKDPAVYEWTSGRGSLTKRANSFVEWLKGVWSSARERYGKRKWSTVMSGPPEFNASERAIVRTRAGFSWKQLAANNGKVCVEIDNKSDEGLQWYTIGVRSRRRNFVGAFYIDVSRVPAKSCCSVEVAMGGYSHLLSAEMAELFDKGQPLPESRDEYKELMGLLTSERGVSSES